VKFLYLDESGDLGFNLAKKRTSRFFVISLVIANDDRVPARVIKKTFRATLKIRPNMLFHSYSESERIRLKLLRNLVESELTFASIILEKKASLAKFKKNDIYLALTLQLLREINLAKSDEFHLVAEKSSNKKSIDRNFISRIKEEFSEARVQILRPQEEKGLQAADFVAHATWLKYEQNDNEFWSVIKDKTRDALARIHPVPPDRGIYLSTSDYTKNDLPSQEILGENCKKVTKSGKSSAKTVAKSPKISYNSSRKTSLKAKKVRKNNG